MNSPFIEGDKIYFRAVEKEDFTERLYTWRNDPEVTRLLIQGIFPSTKEALEEEYNGIVHSKKDVVFSIVEKETGIHFGFVGLYAIDWIARHAEHRVIFGDRTFWGKGYAREMIDLSVSYGFERLNLNKIRAGINIENIPSIKMYEHNGWKHDGVLRQHQYRNGKYYDAIIMSILRDEYFARKGKK